MLPQRCRPDSRFFLFSCDSLGTSSLRCCYDPDYHDSASPGARLGGMDFGGQQDYACCPALSTTDTDGYVTTRAALRIRSYDGYGVVATLRDDDREPRYTHNVAYHASNHSITIPHYRNYFVVRWVGPYHTTVSHEFNVVSRNEIIRKMRRFDSHYFLPGVKNVCAFKVFANANQWLVCF